MITPFHLLWYVGFTQAFPLWLPPIIPCLSLFQSALSFGSPPPLGFLFGTCPIFFLLQFLSPSTPPLFLLYFGQHRLFHDTHSAFARPPPPPPAPDPSHTTLLNTVHVTASNNTTHLYQTIVCPCVVFVFPEVLFVPSHLYGIRVL